MKKVWTFVIGSPLTKQALEELTLAGRQFVNQWTAHENKLNATFEIFKERIVIITVDEASHGASGCSIDKLMRFIGQCEQDFNCELINRLNVVAEIEQHLFVCKASDIPKLLESGLLSSQTIIYNTSISTGDELLSWRQPLESTWLKKYLIKMQ